MIKKYLTLLVIAAFLLINGVFIEIKANEFETKEFKPSISCTKMMCYKENPCCNTCIADGWISTDNLLIGEGKGVDLPKLKVNGCRQIETGPALIEAYGYINGSNGHFYINSYKIKESK